MTSLIQLKIQFCRLVMSIDRTIPETRNCKRIEIKRSVTWLMITSHSEIMYNNKETSSSLYRNYLERKETNQSSVWSDQTPQKTKTPASDYQPGKKQSFILLKHGNLLASPSVVAQAANVTSYVYLIMLLELVVCIATSTPHEIIVQ